MAQGSIFQLPIDRTWNQDGTRSGGAKLSVQLAGTSTATSLFLDAGLTLPCATPASPLVADVNGVFPEIYSTPGVSYKVTLTDANNNPLPGYPADNVPATPSISGTTDLIETAGEAIASGQAVYLSDGSGGRTVGLIYRADLTNAYSSMTVTVGIAPAAIAQGASGIMRINGQVTGLSGLVSGSPCWVNTLGTITTTQPAANARYLGQADSTTSMIVSPFPPPQNLGVGGTTGKANATTFLRGDLSWQSVPTAFNIIGKTANYSANLNDLIEVTSGSGLTITLPAASTATATAYIIGLKNDTANAITVARTGADTIDGGTSFVTNGVQYESYDFVANAAKSGWMVR